MAAALQYKWDYIGPGSTVGLFLHGFGPTHFGVFDARPINIGKIGSAFTPVFDIQLTQGEVSIHVDNTFARTILIKNLAAFNATGAGLYFIFA